MISYTLKECCGRILVRSTIMTNILGKYGRIGSKGVREKRRGIEYLIGPHRRVLYGGDRNGRITSDRTILPPDQTDREGRILKSLGSVMHLV